MFVCGECGYKSVQKFGQCPYCGKWNTIKQEDTAAPAAYEKARKISDVETSAAKRISTGLPGVDSVFGGGIVRGSVSLIAGAPGIGKSTLLMQISSGIKNVLYVSGEESPGQIRLRSDRLNTSKAMPLLASQDFVVVEAEIKRLKPDVVIVDSIQSIHSRNDRNFAASVAEMKESAAGIVETAKTSGVSFILSGHITKEGVLQGPKVIEHMVDAVMYIEDSPDHAYRIFHSTKNRFGNTREFSLFHMTGSGLETVPDASQYFLSGRGEIPGSVAVAASRGSSVFLAEVQALINTTSFQFPRRQVTGLELNRIYLVLAILERFTSVKLSSSDVYLNVAGGIRINEPASDLAAAVAIVSAYRKMKVAKDTAIAGELGLGGEIRNVSRLDERIAKAASLGFGRIIVPVSRVSSKGIEVVKVRNIAEALDAAVKK